MRASAAGSISVASSTASFSGQPCPGGSSVALGLCAAAVVAGAGYSLTRVSIAGSFAASLPPSVFDCLRFVLPSTTIASYMLPPLLLLGWAAMLSGGEPEGCWVFGPGVLCGGQVVAPAAPST